MFKSTIKTTAVLLLAAALSVAIAKDDNKSGKDNKGGKGKTGTSAAATHGAAPAGDAAQVADAAAKQLGFDAGGVVAAVRDDADGSISFIWAVTPPPGSRMVRGYYMVRRLVTVNGALAALDADCRRVLADDHCKSMGL